MAAVTLLRLPLARISTHLRSIHSPLLPPPRRRFATSYRLLSSSLGHGPAAATATAAASEVVAAPYDEEELVGATEDIHDELTLGAAEEAPRPFVLPRLPRPKLTVKERKELASYAHGLGKKLKSQQVGKSGVTPSLVSAFTDNLESNELLKLKIHGNCPEELPKVILKLEESTGSVVIDQIGRSVILYRPSSSKMKKRQEVAKTLRRFVKSEETSEERPKATTGKRSFKPGWTFRAQQKRRPTASRGSSYSRG